MRQRARIPQAAWTLLIPLPGQVCYLFCGAGAGLGASG